MSAFNLDALQGLNTGKVAKLTSGVLVVLVILLMVQLAWRSLQLIRYQPAQPASTSSAEPDNASPRDYQAANITSNYLFGRGAIDNAIAIPETSLQLLLRGAFTATQPKMASAIIEIPGGQTNSYRIDQTVYGQAKLHEVHSDRIVLSSAGELETLYFPAPSEQLSGSVGSEQSVAGFQVPSGIQQLVRDNMSADEIQRAARQLSNASMSAEERQDMIRQRLQDLRERARKKREANAATR